jgi:hypothetical protein
MAAPRIEIVDLGERWLWVLLDVEGRVLCAGTPCASRADALHALERARVFARLDANYRRGPRTCELVDENGDILATFDALGTRERELCIAVTKFHLWSSPIEPSDAAPSRAPSDRTHSYLVIATTLDFACPNCSTADAVRSAVYGEHFSTTLAWLSLPLAFITALAVALYFIGWRRPERHS